MEKILKPYTIIPEELYIPRDADKQVRNIISDMGRPGYVLVSRQMGKTNLLLNAKRKLEKPNDAFIYIDLSNTFPTAKSCFENIIDSAIDTFPEKFEEIYKIILERRKELKETPPHKQHTNELRFLLQALKGGKMVIILDEIDALTKTDYSDQIFSQIRSSYFASRVNYKEFYNLTYLLSGVVEPNEIIKDPKVSPFNIGQKIYLNDFSKEELKEFLVKANLNISEESTERIYYWTNGNPRMSWDVCSEVENKLKSKECDVFLIDRIVQDLYLTSFDKAPIDNIREIVTLDREIRNSIIEIEYKKGKSVSDKIKSKLYLAGIINYDENDVHIKNEIIRKCLNYDWIRKLEEQEKGLINLALEEYQNLKYAESLSSFEKFLQHNEFDHQNRFHYYYVMGLCAYSLANYNKAIECFEKANFDVQDEAIWHYKVLNQKGLTYYYLNKIDDSLYNYKKIIDNGKKDSTYSKVLLNYGIISLKSDKTIHKDEAIKVFNDIIDDTVFMKDRPKESVINELKSIAHYNIAQIQKFDENIYSSIINYKAAISTGKEIINPKYILALLDINKNKDENYFYLNLLVDSITTNKISPKDEDPERPMDFSFDEFKQVCIIAFCEYREDLFPKLESHLSILGNFSLLQHLYDLAVFSINMDRIWEKALNIFTFIYEQLKIEGLDIKDETRYNTLKLLAYGSERIASKEYKIEYINLFEVNRLFPIDSWDIEIFINLIFLLTEEKKFDEALKYVSIINSLRNPILEENLIEYIVIYHLELNIQVHVNNKLKSIALAKQIIELSINEETKKQKSLLLGETGLDIIRQYAQSVLDSLDKNNMPVKSKKIYGRNDVLKVRYKDGYILETKFKKIQKDLMDGICFILS